MDNFESLYNRRKRNHDYCKPFIYHLIFKKNPAAPVFSRILTNNSDGPIEPEDVRLDYTPLGFSIFYSLKDFYDKYKEFKKIQYSIMPDHLHLILQKLVWTPIHLETYMDKFKEMVSEKYRKNTGKTLQPLEIFMPRFTDKLLYDKIKLDTWVKYVSHNPYRRAVIIRKPDFFNRNFNLVIGGETYQAYGNLFLLQNPDKCQVWVRRKFSSEEFSTYRNIVLEKAATGSILVSPFISKKEKDIRKEAESLGAKFIKICYAKLGDNFKPSRNDFDLCKQGRLLIISLGLDPKTPLLYDLAHKMNLLAERIVASF